MYLWLVLIKGILGVTSSDLTLTAAGELICIYIIYCISSSFTTIWTNL